LVRRKLKSGQKAGEVGPVIDGEAQARILKYINEAGSLFYHSIRLPSFADWKGWCCL
jgi:hypothetical protein